MSESFGKIVAIMLAMIIMFFGPLYYSAQKMDAISQNYVSNETADFVDTIKNTGKITERMYNDFIKKLDKTGNLYTIDIVHHYEVVNPEIEVDSNKIIDGSYVVNKEASYTNDILKVIYESGVYEMNKDDTISIKVYNRTKTLSGKLQQMFLKTDIQTEQIISNYGGIIRDEDF